jgi:DNA polymerase III epsilon subunit-like protein
MDNVGNDGYEMPASKRRRLKKESPTMTIRNAEYNVDMEDIQNLLVWIFSDNHGSLPKWCIFQNSHKIKRIILLKLVDYDNIDFLSSLNTNSVILKRSSISVCPFKLRNPSIFQSKSLVDVIAEIRVPSKDLGQDGSVDKTCHQESNPTSLEKLLLSDSQLKENGFPDLNNLNYKTIIGDGPCELVDILGIDCEMILTELGMELARVSVVNLSGQILIDLHVKVSGNVVDYLSKYSGITAETLRNATHDFHEAQDAVVKLIKPTSILVGHSLENDLNILKIAFNRIVDTSVLYCHPRGPPSKLSLQLLAFKILKLKLNRQAGHNSIEDALVPIQLLQKKLENGIDYNPCKMLKLTRDIRDLIESLVIDASEESDFCEGSRLIIRNLRESEFQKNFEKLDRILESCDLNDFIIIINYPEPVKRLQELSIIQEKCNSESIRQVISKRIEGETAIPQKNGYCMFTFGHCLTRSSLS